MEQSENIGALALALSKAQMKIEGAVKNAENPFFKSKYAELSTVWDACHTFLNENELAVVQTTDVSEKQVIVVTTLIHSSGEWIRGKIAMTPKDMSPQAVGSAVSYGRRYALAAMVGVCPVDDDAEAATSHTEPHSEEPQYVQEPAKREYSDVCPKCSRKYNSDGGKYTQCYPCKMGKSSPKTPEQKVNDAFLDQPPF